MFNIDTIGTPILTILFLVELLFSLISGEEKSRTKDMLANVFIGSLVIINGFFMKGLAFTLYSLIYSVAFIKPSNTFFLWFIAFFLCDLVLYFYHLLGHKTRLFWAAHVTHHSSLHYNISVGFRVNFIHLFYRFLFWAPLCLIGIRPEMILFIESLTAIWNFIIHTERVKKLGVLDLIFNTPSNHRVHHASNPEYLDKNLGGILIIFDHLFGTYKKETIPPVYGITHNIYTANPGKIIFHEYIDLLKGISKIKSWKEKLLYLFTLPGDAKPVNIYTTIVSKTKNENIKQTNQPSGSFYSPLKKAI